MDQYIFGGVLFLLCYHIMRASPLANLCTCWNFIKKWYSTHEVDCKYRQLIKLTMFKRKKDFPKLRGKASEVRGLAPALVELWEKYMSKSKSHQKILMLLQKTSRMNDIISEFPVAGGYFKLPAHAAKELAETAFLVGALQKQLSQEYTAAGIKAFTFTPKTHMLQHVALLSKHIHPALTWCYQGEDMMRNAQRLLQACVRGNSPAGTMLKAAAHYKIAMQMKFRGEA